MPARSFNVNLRRLGSANAVLAAVVVAVVVLMVVPLPTWLLDLLLASNLALSVSILLVTLYVGDALRVAAFPTVLLIATLIRLSLNVSSTRLILLQADAGQVIAAFGDFVVRGNHVVGAVVFLILTIIQFVVIAKGSERVAEVGARFTLDAMPGKQMAIDADLRSGAIDATEARSLRRKVERENQFYGAMDGAMKFVKGDVIASVLITAINLVGGLTIGVFQRGLEPLAAAKRYGLLTIGDGLVTQLPALLLATSAGILVTRVASEQPDTALGTELGRQLFGAPTALRVSSLFVAGLGLVPGLPTAPFLIIAGVLFFASRARVRALKTERAERRNEPVVREAGGPRFIPVVAAWGVAVSADLEPLLEDEIRGGQVRRRGLVSATEALRDALFRQLGVPLPPARIAVDAAMPPCSVLLEIGELPTHRLDLGAETAKVDRVQREFYAVLTARAADFVGIAETQALIDELAQVAPATVRAVVPRPVSPNVLADVLRRLLEEGISVRNLKGILETLATVAKSESDPLELAEQVRQQMRRPLTYQLTHGQAELGVVLLDSMLEETIRSAISQTAAGRFLTLAPAAARDVVEAIARAVRATPSVADAVLLTQPDIRRFVRKLIETELPTVRVLSFAELMPEVSLQPQQTATLQRLP